MCPSSSLSLTHTLPLLNYALDHNNGKYSTALAGGSGYIVVRVYIIAMVCTVDEAEAGKKEEKEAGKVEEKEADEKGEKQDENNEEAETVLKVGGSHHMYMYMCNMYIVHLWQWVIYYDSNRTLGDTMLNHIL